MNISLLQSIAKIYMKIILSTNVRHNITRHKTILTELVNDFLGEPVIVDIISGASLDRLGRRAGRAAAGERRQRLLSEHQRQHTRGAEEHV